MFVAPRFWRSSLWQHRTFSPSARSAAEEHGLAAIAALACSSAAAQSRLVEAGAVDAIASAMQARARLWGGGGETSGIDVCSYMEGPLGLSVARVQIGLEGVPKEMR